MSDGVDERGELDKAEQAQAAQFDKAILTVAAALLGLSVTYLKDVAATPPVAIYLLVISWMSIAGSILCTLKSFLTSQEAIRHNRMLIDNPDAEVSDPPQITDQLNNASFYLFAVGLLTFCLFALVNLEQQCPPKNQNQQNSHTQSASPESQKRLLDINPREPVAATQVVVALVANLKSNSLDKDDLGMAKPNERKIQEGYQPARTRPPAKPPAKPKPKSPK